MSEKNGSKKATRALNPKELLTRLQAIEIRSKPGQKIKCRRKAFLKALKHFRCSRAFCANTCRVLIIPSTGMAWRNFQSSNSLTVQVSELHITEIINALSSS